MSRLPSAEDLGTVDAGSGERPVGQINADSLGRAYERLGEGAAQLGRGLNQAGQNLSEVGELKSRYDFAIAHGGFLSDMIGLNEQTQRDVNYGPDAAGNDMSQRYTAAAQQIRDKWGGTLSGPMQGRFVESVAPQIAEGQAHADTRSFNLYRDHEVAQTDTLGEDLGNKATATDDPSVHAAAMDSYRQANAALAARGFITQDEAVKRNRAFGGSLATGLLLQQAETDPLGALNHLRAQPGSDDELVSRIIQIESGGKSGAKSATSSAMGLGQFTNSTWLGLIKQTHPEIAQGRSDADLLALRADPTLSREMTGVLLQQNRSALQGQGLDPSAGNLYLSHFLGSGGAASLLKADPSTPVSALLPPNVIAANRSILEGRTAGSVIGWANNRMGGYAPGEGSIYSMVPPPQRAQLEARLLNMTQAKASTDAADFKQRYEDSVTEAFNTGKATQPLTQDDFVRSVGVDRASSAYQDYQDQLRLGADKQRVVNMDPEAQDVLLAEYTPRPGSDGYAEAAKRQSVLARAVDEARKERDADPAAYAVRNLPAARDAWSKFSTTLSDPQASDDDKRAAARAFATVTDNEQRRVGVDPGDVRVLPKGYIDNFNKKISDAASSDSPAARTGVIGQVQSEASMWGSAWPSVMRELAPTTQPIVRAIAAGADPTAMSRLLSLGKDENPAALLKEQSETKAADLNKAVDQAMAPFLGTLVGRQRDRDYTGYYNLEQRLAALYVRDGQGASDAAAKAFNDLIGARYDFRDSYRIPKSAGVDADQVQAGAQAARGKLFDLGARPPIADVAGADPQQDLRDVGRDAKWVTSPDNDGLTLAYGDKFVRGADGQPFKLGWQQLADLSKQQRAEQLNPPAGTTHREFLARQGVDTAAVAPNQPLPAVPAPQAWDAHVVPPTGGVTHREFMARRGVETPRAAGLDAPTAGASG